MGLSSNASLALSSQLSVLAMRLEARCRVPQGWPPDTKDSELFANYVSLYALCAAGRRATPQINAAAQTLLSMRLPSGLWRVAHADVEPTARATVALQWAETQPTTDLSATIRHIQAHQLADGGWALEGTDVVLNPHGEIGPSLPCTLALRQAQARNADKTIADSLERARSFFKAQLTVLAPEVGKDAKVELAYAWAVRGMVNASHQVMIDDADAHRARLEHIVQQILQRGAPPDDTGFQLLFNALHSVALLVDMHTTASTLDIEEATSCLLAWALLRDAAGQALTRLLAGALLTGAMVMRRRHPGAALSGPAAVPTTADAPVAVEAPTASPTESFVGATWSVFRRRPPAAQVAIVLSALTVAGSAASAVFALGTAAAPRMDEASRVVAARLVGNLEVIVADRSTGQPFAGARVEVRPVAPARILAAADAAGKARLSWNLVDPPTTAVRMEVVAQSRAGGPIGSKLLPDKPASVEVVYVP